MTLRCTVLIMSYHSKYVCILILLLWCMIGSFLWTLIFYIRNIVLYVCCVIYNMLTVLNLDIFLFTIVISYFTVILLFTFKRQKIVLMSFSCPLVFSSSRAYFAYLALDTSTPLHSLYVSQLLLNMFYIPSTQTVDKLLIDFQYHKQNRFIRGFP